MAVSTFKRHLVVKREGGANFSRGLLLVASVLCMLRVVLAATAPGKNHVVGDEKGWNLNVNYTAWAQSRTFVAGDTLLFKYSKTAHTVSQVGEADFETCNVDSVVSTWFDGATVIHLPNTGRFYYVCGIPGHCAAGEKVAIRVVAAVAGGPEPAAGPASAISASSSPRSVSRLSKISELLVLGVVVYITSLAFW